MEFISLNELKGSEIQAKTRGETPRVYARVRSQHLQSTYLGVDNSCTVHFKTTSGTTSGRYWFQAIRLRDLPLLIKQNKKNPSVTPQMLIKQAVQSGNIDVACNDPSFLYWAWKYKAWRQQYGLQRENRAPTQKNLRLRGGSCKHIAAALNYLPVCIKKIAEDLTKKGVFKEQKTDEERMNIWQRWKDNRRLNKPVKQFNTPDQEGIEVNVDASPETSESLREAVVTMDKGENGVYELEVPEDCELTKGTPIPIAKIKMCQPVNVDKVKSLLGKDATKFDPIKVAQYQDDYYLLDGNHRARAAFAQGLSDMIADVYRVDGIKFKNKIKDGEDVHNLMSKWQHLGSVVTLEGETTGYGTREESNKEKEAI